MEEAAHRAIRRLVARDPGSGKEPPRLAGRVLAEPGGEHVYVPGALGGALPLGECVDDGLGGLAGRGQRRRAIEH